MSKLKRVQRDWSEMDSPWIPSTPGGTACTWLAAETEDKAWENLLRDAQHMPYKTKENFIKRGYTVDQWKRTK